MPEELVPFEEVYRQFADRVLRFCVTLLRDVSQAEDVTAEVFVSAYSAYQRVRPAPEGVKPWLFRIARNAAIDHMRKQQTWRRLWIDLSSTPLAELDTEGVAAVHEETREILSGLGALKRRDRQLIGLRHGGGLSFREIGETLGMTDKSARVAYGRAIRRLREAVEGRG